MSITANITPEPPRWPWSMMFGLFALGACIFFIVLIVFVACSRCFGQEKQISYISQYQEPTHKHYDTLTSATANKGLCEVYKEQTGGYNVICGNARQISWVEAV